MSGEEISKELKIRRGTKPSPGTIYPVLKAFKKNNWIEEIKTEGKEKVYKLTEDGKKQLNMATKRFLSIFCDLKEDFHNIK